MALRYVSEKSFFPVTNFYFEYIQKLTLKQNVNGTEWKRSVSYGLGFDIALPPCLLGGRRRVEGRLVSEFSSQYKWSVGGTVGVTYHGTRLQSYVEKYFILVPVFLCFRFPNVKPFRLRILSIINDILDPSISTWRRIDDLERLG